MTKDSLLHTMIGPYRLEAMLGKGGMARVYRAVDTDHNRYVAIKVIDTPLRTDDDHVQRFERESQAIARLDHPHVVTFYEYGDHEGLLYMAMAYIEGADLGTVLDTYRVDGEYMDPQDIARLVRQVGSALDYIHAQGVIHRDVKPSNIMLDKQGQAHLTDFGLALLTNIGTRGEIFGSPHYIAPEQAISSARAQPQTDLYALGVVLYEMVTNRVPFEAEHPMDLASMHISDPPPPPSTHREGLSQAVEAVILKALEKEAYSRFQSGLALADALDAALASLRPGSLRDTSRVTVPQRVELDMEQHPLPPLPAPVAAEDAGAADDVAPPPAPEPPPLPDPTRPNILPEQQTREAARSAPTETRPHVESPAPPTMPAPTAPTGAFPQPAYDAPTTNRSLWYIAAGFIGTLLVLGLAVGLFLALSGNGDDNDERLGGGASPTTAAPTQLTATSVGLVGGQTVTPSPLPPTPTQLVLPSATSLPSTPTVAPTLTVPPSPLSSATPAPTLTLPPSATPTLTPGPVSLTFQLSIATRREDSLVIRNDGPQPFPLGPLELRGEAGNDRTTVVAGTRWGLTNLPVGHCVALKKQSGRADLPRNFDCQQVTERTIENRDVFWKDEFEVYYDGREIEECEGDDDDICRLEITLTTQAANLTTGYALEIEAPADGLLTLENLSVAAFPLADLRLESNGVTLSGTEFNRETLATGQCVVVVRDGSVLFDDLTCDFGGVVNLAHTDRPPFWGAPFTVFFREQPVEPACDLGSDARCLVRIVVE